MLDINPNPDYGQPFVPPQTPASTPPPSSGSPPPTTPLSPSSTVPSPDTYQTSETIQTKPKTQLIASLVLNIPIIAAILSGIIAGILYGLFYYNQIVLSKNKNQIKQLDQEIEKNKDIEAQSLSLKVQLDNIQSLLNQKPSWSKFFEEFNQIIPKNVRLTTLSVDEKNLINLTGETVDYNAVAIFLASLRESKKFTEITLTSTSTIPQKGVLFNASAKIVPNVILPESPKSNNAASNNAVNNTATNVSNQTSTETEKLEKR